MLNMVPALIRFRDILPLLEMHLRDVQSGSEVKKMDRETVAHNNGSQHEIVQALNILSSTEQNMIKCFQESEEIV